MKIRWSRFYKLPYYLWIIVFVIAPLVLLVYQSFFDINQQFTIFNYKEYFISRNYILMTFSSFIYAFVVTLITLILSYPMAYFISLNQYRDFLFILIIIPTWINLLLKVYAFIGLLSQTGPISTFVKSIGLYTGPLLFTNMAFVIVASYIEIPFMLIPILNSIEEIPHSFLEASQDLGANKWQTLTRIIIPMSLDGIRSGIQAVFIPSLSLFMVTRIIGGNRIITLGTAVEQHFLVTQNWGMGSTIGVVLLTLMCVMMFLTRNKKEKGGLDDE